MKHEPQALVPTGSPDTAVAVKSEPIDFSQYAGAGTEHIDVATLSMPFFKVIQSGSPELKNKNEKFIREARAGMVINTLTRELYPAYEENDPGIKVVICSIQERMIRWAPQDESLGRPVASYPKGHQDVPPATPTEIRTQDGTKTILQIDGSKDYLVETDEYYVLRVGDDGTVQPGIIAMDSSDLGPSRMIRSQLKYKYMTQAGKTFAAPIMAQFYNFKATDKVSKTNPDRQWLIWKPTFLGIMQDGDATLLDQAYAWHKVLEPQQTQVKITESSVPQAQPGGLVSKPRGQGAAAEDDVPF